MEEFGNFNFLEAAQLLSKYGGTPSWKTQRIAVSATSLLFVDQSGRSLRFWYLEFDKEDIYDDYRLKKAEPMGSCLLSLKPIRI